MELARKVINEKQNNNEKKLNNIREKIKKSYYTLLKKQFISI